ncbi:MAG: HAMP domain-containing histidine kinase [Bacteroidales bacterium]|nr:HAMP domain-containing histidine kinase [Bacteroidales bacterium]
MNIYIQKKRWKLVLFFIAIIIVVLSLWHTNVIVRNIAKEERNKVAMWADAMQKKASLVNYTKDLFEKLKNDERKKVDLWAEANKYIVEAGFNEDITFYAEIVSNNSSIPVVLTDNEGKITSAVNVDFDIDTIKYLKGKLKEEFSVYPPIVYTYSGQSKQYLYYKDSRLFSELKIVLNDLIKSFISEVVINSAAVPVIITDSSYRKIIAYGNIDALKIRDKAYFTGIISEMKSQNKPIQINIGEIGECFVFYKDSVLLTKLKYYPYIQLAIISIFLFISYILFSTSRKAEQNKVWMGLAKETAHQLGTPLSSLLAWVEMLRNDNKCLTPEYVEEISKDVQRLEMITERFSKIGSPGKLIPVNIINIIHNSIEYLRARTSKKVNYRVILPASDNITLPLNVPLFEWVIENLCKNALDAMDGEGDIEIEITQDEQFVYIDISDNGRGLPKTNYKSIFNPGFTTKQRGWGLGLTLAKRIIENYHKGKIFVKSSVINKGTTFRLILNK